jgi:hypothetical protein
MGLQMFEVPVRLRKLDGLRRKCRYDVSRDRPAHPERRFHPERTPCPVLAPHSRQKHAPKCHHRQVPSAAASFTQSRHSCEIAAREGGAVWAPSRRGSWPRARPREEEARRTFGDLAVRKRGSKRRTLGTPQGLHIFFSVSGLRASLGSAWIGRSASSRSVRSPC